ncbi:MAG: protein-glutamate O-methyltransferase CheR, partial [Desulfocapsaceae bacterium]|nr:protein-glutamate O-methyltransferase CheR [Desulfocapsaceae bacterium]
MKNPEGEHAEIDLLLETIYQRYGYDFRSYARASIERRIRLFLSNTGCPSVAEIIPRIVDDQEFTFHLIHYFSIAVTEMFRDPLVYRAMREKVVPLLRTWPHCKIWHAGCATG